MRYLALLRGVNVGGVKLTMADLRAVAADAGLGDARTYLASGNLIFSAQGAPAVFAETLGHGIAARCGRPVAVLVLGAEAYLGRIADCPYAASEGARVHGMFTFGTPNPDMAAIEALRAPDEELTFGAGVIWLRASEGIGRSKLAPKLERLCGTVLTGRNLNTITALAEMLDGPQA